MSDLRNNPAYIKYYTFWTRVLLTGALPICTLIYLNIRIYRGILQSRERLVNRNPPRETELTHNRKARVRYELNLALVLILLVCIMVICNLPRLLLNFLEYFQLDNILRYV
ncbi:uncharacterized protein LOC111705466 [Eurytemora carolleeae]|uniref:uncharacterized protein LOC111705466 n=1 Tax=Eurytemora carolleeae TaxID=1294199 RepID=UPI000C786730|nr:uncharacterized protein LOC111705466 [Eurytemora carolleeae]|eukprot:XP_023333792.1 uncharacterized protein LOC111705466 [Eurytemora affinis]